VPLPTVTPVLAAITAHVVPWLELLLGICLVIGICVRFAASLTYALILAFIYYNSWMLMNGLGYEPCGCFGIFEKIFLGELSTLDSMYIDIGLLVLALTVFFSYPGKFFNLRLWFMKAE